MATEHGNSAEIDLDKTDRLPILDGSLFAHDVEDDAVRMDHTAVLPNASFVAVPTPAAEFLRPSGVDLPSLAESVRSVEERIARQNAEFESLNRAYERARDVEAASVARANALAVDLAAARAALESEQKRSRELDRMLNDRASSVETARSRVEEALRESERAQIESRTLRDSLAARDGTIAQVLHSLGERDAQLAALQLEHSKMLPVLEATSKSSSQLEADLNAVRARSAAVAADLQASQERTAALDAQVGRTEAELRLTRTELGTAKTQASSYLEQLRTREWRGGFDLNLFRELDAQVGAAHVGQNALESERNRLQSQVAILESKLAAQGDAIDKLQAAAAGNTTTLAQQSNDLKRTEQVRAQLAARLATADAEVTRLNGELSARERALTDAMAASSGDVKRVTELLQAAEQRRVEQDKQIEKLRADHAAQLEQLTAAQSTRISQTLAEQNAQIASLQSEADLREQEMTVLVAHLQEARRPIQVIEAEVKRLSDELAAKSAAFKESEEENAKLRASLERTKGALEEREFLIRRLERSESNNANVLGRIQTSIERLGAATPGTTAAPAAAAAAEWSAELIRIDGERPVTHVLSRRTRIGRAAGCELQIESGSVSRHHALVVVGPREAVIEDLNSTNGVLVNGRKVSRQPLTDGDAVTIGEIQFRYFARPAHAVAEPGPKEPGPAASA
jgi:DNA repair exonuclease SbcCD ATPase subunit